MRKKTDPNSGDLQHAAKKKFIISLIQCHQLLAFVMSPIISICNGNSIVCATGNKLSFIVS